MLVDSPCQHCSVPQKAINTSLAAARLYIAGVDGYISLTKKEPERGKEAEATGAQPRAESATNRERKRSYIEQLEGRIADLREGRDAAQQERRAEERTSSLAADSAGAQLRHICRGGARSPERRGGLPPVNVPYPQPIRGCYVQRCNSAYTSAPPTTLTANRRT